LWPQLGISKRDLLHYYADTSWVLLPPHPEWVETRKILHSSRSTIHFPMIQDLASLLWVVNVGRPDYLHLDLDPSPGATFKQVLNTALAVRSGLSELKIPSYPKTSSSRGIHNVPIRRRPTQRQVWSFAKELARNLLDYSQNAWGRTLASVYSARPRPGAKVATPVGWDEIERGLKIEDFRIDNVPERVRRSGDLFHPLLLIRRRVRWEQFL
jgi:bifunctional non-homologous end joining protein LigD